MADAMQQGIMGLRQAPTGQAADAGETIDPSLFSPVIESYAKTNPVQFGDDMLNSMADTDPQLVKKFKDYLAQVKLPAEVLNAMGQLVDVILGDPARYAEMRADFLAEGVPAELLPEEFDLAFFGALNIALDQLAAAQPSAPMQLAQGGIASLSPVALGISRMGRNEDTMLAHITPSEARMLRRNGGRGTINPDTGLVEYGFFSSLGNAIGKVFKGVGDAVVGVVKGVGNVVKEVASSTVGKIVLTAAAVYFLGPAGLNFAGTAGSITGLTGSLAVGVNTFAASTAIGLASGQGLSQSLKSGALSGLTAGFGSAVLGLPSGYEGSTPGGVAPVVDKALPSLTAAPVTAPSMDLSTPGIGGAQVFPAVNPAPLVATPLESADDLLMPYRAVDVARAPVTNITAPSEIVPAATSAAPSSFAPAPLSSTTPPVTDAYTGSGLNLKGYSGSGIKLPGVTPTVEQMGIESLTAKNLPNVTGAVSTSGQAAAPGFMESLKQGNLTDAAKAAYRNISPSEIQQQGTAAAQDAGVQAMDALKARLPNATPSMLESAYNTAVKAAMPGLISTYGPLALAGVGVMGAMGGFKKEQGELPPGFSGPTGAELLEKNPETYGLNFGGVRSSYALNPYDYMYQTPQAAPRSQMAPMKAATGGIASLNRYAGGGQAGHYPRKTGPINGPGTGTSDSIPAMLSDGEFVFTAKAVRGAGNGSRRSGAKRMYALMKVLERKT